MNHFKILLASRCNTFILVGELHSWLTLILANFNLGELSLANFILANFILANFIWSPEEQINANRAGSDRLWKLSVIFLVEFENSRKLIFCNFCMKYRLNFSLRIHRNIFCSKIPFLVNECDAILCIQLFD